MRINTNLNSIIAANAYQRAALDVRKSLTRMSTGLRINQAADDAAGLSISEHLRMQVRGLGQAAKNVQDATIQQLDTEATRSEHVRESFNGYTGAVATRSNVSGSVTVADPMTITFTTDPNDPLDQMVTLRRIHDGAVVDPSYYTLLSAVPVPERTQFQVQLTDPAATIFTRIGEQRFTNLNTGKITFGSPTNEITAVNAVRRASTSQKFYGDADGLVTVAEGPLTRVRFVQRWNGVAWVPLTEKSSGVSGQTVYE